MEDAMRTLQNDVTTEPVELIDAELDVVGAGGPPTLRGQGAYGTAYEASGGSSTHSNDGLDTAFENTWPHPIKVGAGRVTAGFVN
jgi:hypothetical protein